MQKIFVFLGLMIVQSLIFSTPTFSQDPAAMPDYIIHPSDILEISVYGEAELTKELVVRPDGKISYPLIGDIGVAGLSPGQIKMIVDTEISAFIPEASSTVIVKSLGSLKYYVVGEVSNPGMFNVSTQLTVLQALSLAGGLKTFAEQDNIIIVRGHGKGTVKISFDYDDAKKGKKLEQNILLKRGDVVLVP